MEFDYYYGKEADTFSFYRVPKILFSEAYFKGLSVEAKVLYGLMLDRMSLSMKNQWIDAEGKVYINFSVENIQEYMGCSKNKAVAILKELDSDGGIGLVEKKRMGQGKTNLSWRLFQLKQMRICLIRFHTSRWKTWRLYIALNLILMMMDEQQSLLQISLLKR